MSAGDSGSHPPGGSLRARAERDETPDLEGLTSDEIQTLVHELQVHQLELHVQNEQLQEAQTVAADSNERFRRLYDAAPTGYLTLDLEGRILEANLAATLVLKTSRSRLIGTALSSFIAAHCQDRWYLARRDLQEGQARLDLALDIVSSQGTAVDAQIVAVSTPGDLGAIEIQLALIDMTDLRRTERALQAAIAAATLAEERERRKLASDLHDDAGQLLSLASLKLHTLSAAAAVDRGAQMAELESLLQEIRRRISSLSFQLSPPLLHDVGLVAALQWLSEDLENVYGLRVTITQELEPDIDENTRIIFYRAIRELLINVVKHSGVKAACIRISAEGSMARIAVEDSGVGMPPRARRYGFGLLALRERIESLGGALETRSTEGGGTTVVVRLPLKPLPSEA